MMQKLEKATHAAGCRVNSKPATGHAEQDYSCDCGFKKQAILDAATPNSHAELEKYINSLSKTAFHCLGRYQKRYESDQLLIAEMVKALSGVLGIINAADYPVYSHGEIHQGEIALAHAREQKPELWK